MQPLRSLRAGLSAVLALHLALGFAAAQDTVTMHNGDRISGTVTAITAAGVVVDSPAAGTVTIAIDEIAGMTAATPLRLATSSGDKMEVTVTGLQNGQLQVAGPDGPRSIPAAELVEWKPDTSWAGTVAVGGSMTTGNTERRSANANGEAIRRTEDTRLTLRATWDYAQDKTTGAWLINQRRTFGSAKYDWFFDPRTYLYGQATAENDKFADLSLRLTAGAGVGYQIYDEADYSLQGEAGLTYIDEAHNVSADTEFLAVRLAYRARWSFSDKLTLLQDGEFYPSLEDVSDFYARIDSRARATLTASMFAQVQWVWDYDSTPATGLKESDHRVIAAVGWTF